MERIMITGGAGFIGSHLAQVLADRGAAVLIYDLRYGDDVCKYDSLREAMEGVGTVYHLAAVSAVEDVMADPEGSGRTNITGTLNVLRAATMQNVNRVIFASSAAVYGASLYGWQKRAGELCCDAFPEICIWRLRLFNVYGKGANQKAAIPAFIANAMAGEPLVVHGDGRQTRDMIHISDVVSAMMKCGTCPAETQGTYEIGSGTDASVKEIAELVCSTTGKKTRIVYGPQRPGDIMESRADISRARSALGWGPQVLLPEGIRAMLWAKGNCTLRAA